MQIPVIKNELASALPALGKLVSRTSLIKTYQGIEIEGKANMLYFRTRNVIEQIEFRLFADLEDDFPAILVEFEQFRQMVRSCKNKTLKLEIDCGEVFIDDVKLAPIKGHFPLKEQIPDQDITVTELPADTLSALSLLAPITDKGTDVRKVLGGINISGDGFTATNGKELSNIPLKLETSGSVTIPFPLALLATKAFGDSGRLSTWQKDEDTHFELTLGAWTWQTKALKGNYPNWKRVVPERTEATHYVSFQDDRAERLQRYLKSIPDDKDHNNAVKLSRLPEVPDKLHLESSNGMLFSILAEFDPNWNDLNFCVRKEFLLRLLDAGHRRIELNDAYGPIVGTGGSGQYIAMPIITKKGQAQNEQNPEQVAPAQSDVNPEVQTEQIEPQSCTENSKSVSEQIPPQPQENKNQTTNTNITSNKENTTMNEPTTIRTVSAPTQIFTPNNEPVNPLDELTSKIEGMKNALKDMIEEVTAMSRKIREVSIAQRQKDREYNQTKRALDRVRVATGAA